MSSRRTAASPSNAARVLLAALLLASGLTVVGLAPPAAAAARADLTVSAVRSPGSAAPGEQVALTAVVKNVGRRDAATTSTRFALSRDQVSGGSDTTLGTVRTRALDRRSQRTVRLSATVPAAQATGRWYVVACADAKRRVRESREGNNCRASAALTLAAPAGGQFPMEPEPVDVGAATLETGRAVTSTAFPFTDTTITTTGSDGTTYTLEVPEGALLSSLPITMTPVSEVADLPGSGLRAAVQLEPHGLLLQEPATLTIDSPELGPLADQTAFLFHGGGDDFHPYPPAMPEPGDGVDVMRLQLSHFSTPGVVTGPAPGVPVRSLGQLEAAVSQVLAAERASQLAGSAANPAAMQQVHTLLRSYYDSVLRQQLQAAESDPERAAQATSEALAWMRQLQLTGVEEDPRFDDAWARIEKIWRNAMNASWAQCVTEHDVVSAGVLMGIARQAALFGWSWSEEAQDKARRCANFEVRFSSDLTTQYQLDGDTQDQTTSGSWGLRSTTELPWTGIGEAPLTYSGFSYHHRTTYPPHDDCGPLYIDTVGTGTSPGALIAMMAVDLNPREIPPGEDNPPPPVVTLRVLPGSSLIGPGRPTEDYHTENVTCAPGSSDTTEPRWIELYQQLHQSGPRWQGGGLALTVTPQQRVGDILFSEQWTTQQGNGTSQARRVDVTKVELVHKPLS